MAVSRWPFWVALGTLTALTVASVAWSVPTPPPLSRHAPVAAQSTATTTTTLIETSTPSSPVDTVVPTTTVSPSQTPVTGPPGVSVPTTIVTYPNPYHPSYDTIASLVYDSDYIVIATLGAGAQGGDELQVEAQLGFNDPRTLIGVTTAEINAAHLTSGDTYIFFYGVDTVDKLECVVGGVRGVFAYNPTTQIVTRIDQSTPSQIPNTQTLTQLETAINDEESIESAEPISNGPPLCSSSATGL